MGSITIYGASDDLVEVEGDIVEEFNPYDGDEPSYLAASDGTMLRITYDGMWHVAVPQTGAGTKVHIEPATDEDSNYSDKVTLTSEKPFEFVVFGQSMAKRRAPK
jgi:hypothetical protein